MWAFKGYINTNVQHMVSKEYLLSHFNVIEAISLNKPVTSPLHVKLLRPFLEWLVSAVRSVSQSEPVEFKLY